MPDVASVWVAVFRNVAIRAHASAAAIAKTAARRTGEPRIPAAASTAIAPPDANTADSHCAVSGAGCPPPGSATVRNTASAAQTTSFGCATRRGPRQPRRGWPRAAALTSSTPAWWPTWAREDPSVQPQKGYAHRTAPAAVSAPSRPRRPDLAAHP
jgi:hypothetical protein